MFRRQGCSCVWSGDAGWMMSDRERGETDSSVSPSFMRFASSVDNRHVHWVCVFMPLC